MTIIDDRRWSGMTLIMFGVAVGALRRYVVDGYLGALADFALNVIGFVLVTAGLIAALIAIRRERRAGGQQGDVAIATRDALNSHRTREKPFRDLRWFGFFLIMAGSGVGALRRDALADVLGSAGGFAMRAISAAAIVAGLIAFIVVLRRQRRATSQREEDEEKRGEGTVFD